MAGEAVRELVLPRGTEGLAPEGGWKEGEPLVSPEALAAVQAEADRVRVLDTAAAVARGEGTKAAEAVLAKEKDAKAGQLFAFKAFLGSLEDLAGRDAGAMSNPEETRLVLRLYRLEETGGPRPTATYQTAATFSAGEALALGDPDFEGRAQAWAEKAGRFGKFQWRILGWAAGEQTLDTTYNVTIEPPPGFVPTRAPETPEQKDPMSNLKESLGLVSMVKDALGLGSAGGGKVDVDGIRAAARLEAMMEADRQRREELQRLEDRWETKLEAAKDEAYKRGVTDGRREAEDEWRPKVWELEQRVKTEKDPSLLEEAARMVGGPEVVAKLAQLVITSMAAPKPSAIPVRPAVAQVAPAAQPAPAPRQAPAPPAVLAGAEPTRAEWRQAMEDTEEALAILDEHGDQSQETAQLRQVFAAFVATGAGEGSLVPWWQAWNQGIGQAVRDMLAAAEPESEETPAGGMEEPMDFDGMKRLLAQRLDEGAEDAAILQELDSLTTPEQRHQWRGFMRLMPVSTAAGMIGEERHQVRLESLVRAFMERRP